jgi:uncharacterized membrane protein
MLYKILLFVHIMAVIMWLGAGTVFQFVSEKASAENDQNKMRMLVSLGDSFGKAYFGVLTLLVLLSGVFMVIEGDWGFDQAFVIGGIVGIVASGALGGAVIGPTSERLQERIGGDAPIDDSAVADFTKIRNVGRIDLSIMTVVVFLMTYKPGL